MWLADALVHDCSMSTFFEITLQHRCLLVDGVPHGDRFLLLPSGELLDEVRELLLARGGRLQNLRESLLHRGGRWGEKGGIGKS